MAAILAAIALGLMGGALQAGWLQQRRGVSWLCCMRVSQGWRFAMEKVKDAGRVASPLQYTRVNSVKVDSK